MIFNCLTIFPEMFAGFTGTSLCEKAIQKGLIEVNPVNFRDYTEDRHNRVDAYPFGGGAANASRASALHSVVLRLLTGSMRGKRRTASI